MLFGKKDQKKNKEKPKVAKPKMEPYDIHVMPSKFHKYLAVPKKSGLGKIAVIGLIAMIVFLGIAIGVFYLFKQISEQQVAPPVVEDYGEYTDEDEDNGLVEEPIEDEEPEPEPGDEDGGTEPEPDDENGNGDEDQPGTGDNNQPNEDGLIIGADADGDGLTDKEEDLLSTAKRQPDTDGDGFLDGDEVEKGYNPNAGGGQLITQSAAINTYLNRKYSYQVLYPSGWNSRPVDDTTFEEVWFISGTPKEYIEVMVVENADRKKLVDWYLGQAFGTNITEVEKITTAKGFEGLISPNKLSYYLIDPADLTKVYIFNYNQGDEAEISYLAILKMMVNNFVTTEIVEESGTE